MRYSNIYFNLRFYTDGRCEFSEYFRNYSRCDSNLPSACRYFRSWSFFMWCLSTESCPVVSATTSIHVTRSETITAAQWLWLPAAAYWTEMTSRSFRRRSLFPLGKQRCTPVNNALSHDAISSALWWSETSNSLVIHTWWVHRRSQDFQRVGAPRGLTSHSTHSRSFRRRVIDTEITSLPKVIWEEGRVAAKVSHGAVKSPLVTMARPKFASKVPLPVDRSPNPTTCLIPGPVGPMMPNGIWIWSAVFPQCTGQTDAQTDRSSTGKFDDYRPLRL